jgi:hypothetical protein
MNQRRVFKSICFFYSGLYKQRVSSLAGRLSTGLWHGGGGSSLGEEDLETLWRRMYFFLFV